MEDIFVARIMSSTVHTVSPDTLVEEAAQLMLEENIGSVVVVDEADRLEGILTSTDFVRIVAERQPKDRTPVSAYMTPEVITADPQDNVQAVADRLITYSIHHMPVVSDDDVVLGMVTTTDVTNYVSTLTPPIS